ncbi:hypothetical protein MRX96_030206 [Rhipicephalus microplus]
MSEPKFQRGNDFEILMAHADHCPVDNMVRVECRTVDRHIPWNETGDSMLCSVATGLRCLKEDQYGDPCADYEMRVYCQCAEETTPTPFIPTTVTLIGPYCDAWTPWINQDTPSDDGGDNELLANIPRFSEICPELAAVECLPADPAHSADAEEEMAKFAEPCNKKGLLCTPGTPCADYKVRAYCKCPSTEVPTTPLPEVTTTIKFTGDVSSSFSHHACVPPGSRWSECGVRCNATCDHFLHALRTEGFCVGEDDATCVAGCFGAGSHCELGSLHFDWESCVPAQHCPCFMQGQEAPLAPGEVVEQECEKCQCLHNQVSCVSIPGCGTTAASETTTAPVPTTVWSPSPEAIECRVTGNKTHWTQAGQKVECSLQHGMRCWNSDNGPRGCLDYEVRLYCPCEEVVPTTTTKEVVTPECRQGWSSWINSHTLDNLGDQESLQSVIESGLLDCPKPTSIECRETGTRVPWNLLGMIGVRCDLSSGLLCRSSAQPKGRSCVDFEVRFYCDCGVRGHPELEGFCEHGYVSAANCRNDQDVDFSQTGQLGLECSITNGFTCSDADQPADHRCENYKIRFYCSCEGSTSTEIVVIPTQPPDTTSFLLFIHPGYSMAPNPSVIRT